MYHYIVGYTQLYEFEKNFLLDFEIVGSKVSIFGDQNEILSIVVEHKNDVKFRYCMRKEAFFELIFTEVTYSS